MYLKPKNNNRAWVIDIETESLDPKIIWVLCAVNVVTGEELSFTDYAKMREFINEELRNGAIFIGHNAIAFDVAVLNRILGTRIPINRVVDTLVLSMLYSPALAGGHSLEAWGNRLGFKKLEFNDWSKLSDEMVLYCLVDCRLCRLVWISLADRMSSVGFSERSCEIEHRAWSIIQRQRKAGFKLDIPRAHELYAELRGLEKELKEQIYERWPPVLLPVKRFAKANRADGKPSANYERHFQQYPKLRFTNDGGYEAFDWVEFDLGSPKQRAEKLLELGWKPKEFTEKGAPQATRKGQLVPSLKAFLEKSPTPEVQLLAEWIAINARGNMIRNWLDLADNEGLIHGKLWFAGSLRYRHSDPNTANIPAVRVKDDRPLRGRDGQFTYEARDLWVTRDTSNRRLVGVDAKGIQLRVLAHYLNNPEFTEQLLNGDPHEYNRQLAGIDTRAKAKTFIYAFLLGAGDAKVGEIIGGNSREGGLVKNRFINNFPGLQQLLRRLDMELKRTGRITLCDGSKVLVPAQHAVLGYLLQGDESRIMKQAMIYVDQEVRKQRLDVIKVGDIHDEWQNDVFNDHVGDFVSICNRAFPEAGRSFNYNIPIECDSKVGLTWAETH